MTAEAYAAYAERTARQQGGSHAPQAESPPRRNRPRSVPARSRREAVTSTEPEFSTPDSFEVMLTPEEVFEAMDQIDIQRHNVWLNATRGLLETYGIAMDVIYRML